MTPPRVPVMMGPVDIETARRALSAEIRVHGTPEGNPWLQHYSGSSVRVLGLSTPVLREIRKRFVREHRDWNATSVNALTNALWNGDVLEEKMLAIELLVAYRHVLVTDSWRMVDRWVDTAVGWALCDALGSGPIAEMAYGTPARFRELLRWTRSTTFWRRRVSTYALRTWVRARDLDRPFQLLERLLYDPEFWVQRAVGTWLRECWKVDPRRTAAFLRTHAKGLPRVTITVATERAPKGFRQELRRRAGPAPKARGRPVR